MLFEANGDEIETTSARGALERFGPHEHVALVHRRGDGAVLRATGSSVRGFVIEVTGGHTGARTSANRAIRESTIATMFDRFAAGDTGWPGPVVWQDETDASTPRRSRSLIPGLVAAVTGLVLAVVAIALLRRTVIVPWVCGRDGGEVSDVRLGRGGIGIAGTDECVFADGRVIRVLDVDATLGWAEIIATTIVALVLWYLFARLIAKLITRS